MYVCMDLGWMVAKNTFLNSGPMNVNIRRSLLMRVSKHFTMHRAQAGALMRL